MPLFRSHPPQFLRLPWSARQNALACSHSTQYIHPGRPRLKREQKEFLARKYSRDNGSKLPRGAWGASRPSSGTPGELLAARSEDALSPSSVSLSDRKTTTASEKTGEKGRDEEWDSHSSPELSNGDSEVKEGSLPNSPQHGIRQPAPTKGLDPPVAPRTRGKRNTRLGKPKNRSPNPLENDASAFWDSIAPSPRLDSPADRESDRAADAGAGRKQKLARGQSQPGSITEAVRDAYLPPSPKNGAHIRSPSTEMPADAHSGSLFAELFPLLAQGTSEQHKPRGEREIPKLELPRLEPPPVKVERPSVKQLARIAKKPEYRKFSSVLLLVNSSTSLVESDFRAVVPRGQHLPEWTGLGQYTKIVPHRNRFTLEKTGAYYICFDTPAAAQLYMNRAAYLHRIARRHQVTSLLSPIPPPPGTIYNGEDLYELIQSYTLAPLSANLRLKQLFHPLSELLARVLNDGDYPRLVQKDWGNRHRVLLSLEGQPLDWRAMKQAIFKDGRARGVDWSAVTPEKTYLQVLHLQTENWVSVGEELNQQPRRPPGTDLPPDRGTIWKYLAGFARETEAQRFVRNWHRKPVPFVDVEDVEGPPIVNAELLW